MRDDSVTFSSQLSSVLCANNNQKVFVSYSFYLFQKIIIVKILRATKIALAISNNHNHPYQTK